MGGMDDQRQNHERQQADPAAQPQKEGRQEKHDGIEFEDIGEGSDTDQHHGRQRKFQRIAVGKQVKNENRYAIEKPALYRAGKKSDSDPLLLTGNESRPIDDLEHRAEQQDECRGGERHQCTQEIR
ncbi:hypothetical protein D3C87_1644110 [compost metagenome]